MQQQGQNSAALLNQNSWSSMLPQNQNQQFNHFSPSTSWQHSQPMQHHTVPSAPMPQMQPQGYSMPPQFHQTQNTLPFDLTSIVPQQIMQDVLRLSTPVGSSSNDDTILAQALYESKQNGKTYRQALEGLHGVNNHAANLWKDYYLDHHDRFNILVSRLAEQPKTVKKPFATSRTPPHGKEEGASPQVARKRHVSPSPPPQPPKNRGRGRPAASSQATQRKRVAHATQVVATPSPALSRPLKRPRATLNSLSAPLPSNDVPNLMPPQVDIPLPDPPSRSPTPPTLVQLGTNGNKYTKEDRDYFINFLMWQLKRNPSLTKKELCEQLNDKAPHHSATSWASHWHQRHDIADKILATYRRDYGSEEEADEEDEEEDDEEDDAESEAVPSTQTPRSRTGPGTFLDFADPNIDTEEDEADMGEPGSAFTRGDWCIIARFIAKNHWDEMASKERWDTFTDTYETRRSGKSWAEFYRRNETAILKLSKRYSPGAAKCVQSQRGRPSWAKIRDALQDAGSDEDGDYETDNGDS
ncbi:hypothetical protein PAXINDRAFT_173914 [Paxillus involutus ATCC 200175]|nr:hypothetical protein PAXINDRAFT_173914 [Paxillus involutus ATCC 200175]